MPSYVTAREIRKLSSPAQHPQYVMTIPAGTLCKCTNNEFVIADTSKVVGGNSHDLRHYYIWLDPDEVKQEE